MITKILAALILPGLLVILFSRVTYNYVVGLLLTTALIIASAYKGYTYGLFVVVADALSLTIGLWYSKQMIEKYHLKNKNAEIEDAL
ncbi:CsbA family protein [Bacillus sp. P1(2020)]|uniref:CsbA family protein n=1 Tax=Pallidibacillus pasinlerensis TaxID=2703818 RepID=A0ABX0A7W1_9BACI|nr:CsbA family protein [Pallidibacillus pasinlerensis]